MVTTGYRMLRLKEVEEITGLKKSTIYARISDGAFPKATQMGPSVRWRSDRLYEWLDSHPDVD